MVSSLPLHWKKVRVEDVAAEMGDAPFGSSLKTKDYTDSGALVVQGRNIQGRICDWTERRYVDIEKYNSLSRSHCFPGDLIFPKVGTIGKVGILSSLAEHKEYILSTNTMRLRPNSEIASRDYLYYYFLSPAIRNLIIALNSKSVQPVFNYTTLKSFEVILPPLYEQKEIAHILGTLDDKIELNQQMNRTLEGIARALFKSWFIDFDPVRAKLDGRQPYGMDAEIAALFPDSFDDSPLGKIPKGWKAGTADDIITILSGGTPKTSMPVYWNGNIPWFSVKDAPAESDIYVLETEKYITESGVSNSSTQVLPVGTTIVSARGTVGRLALVGCPMAMNQSCYGITGKGNYASLFIYYFMRSAIISLQQQTHGTVFETITRQTFTTVKTVNPPAELAQEFDKAIRPLLQQIRGNLFEIKTLSSIRDTLLPKLLSGEIRVKDAEQALEAVV
jgi:type I restriction enzyme S subunit